MPNFSCPPDFQDHAPTQTNRHLADRYGVGEKMITRWRKETGCTAAIRPFSSALPKAHVRAMTSGAVSEAAQFLRKTYRPVYNRAIEGKEFRGQYVVGTHVLSEDEVVALAEAKGLRAYIEADPLAVNWRIGKDALRFGPRYGRDPLGKRSRT